MRRNAVRHIALASLALGVGVLAAFWMVTRDVANAIAQIDVTVGEIEEEWDNRLFRLREIEQDLQASFNSLSCEGGEDFSIETSPKRTLFRITRGLSAEKVDWYSSFDPATHLSLQDLPFIGRWAEIILRQRLIERSDERSWSKLRQGTEIGVNWFAGFLSLRLKRPLRGELHETQLARLFGKLDTPIDNIGIDGFVIPGELTESVVGRFAFSYYALRLKQTHCVYAWPDVKLLGRKTIIAEPPSSINFHPSGFPAVKTQTRRRKFPYEDGVVERQVVLPKQTMKRLAEDWIHRQWGCPYRNEDLCAALKPK